MPKLFDITTKILEASIRGTVVRQQVIANNISNADTPAFRAADVSFEKQLKAALEKGKNNDSSKPSNVLTVERHKISLSEGPLEGENQGVLLEAIDQPRLDGNTVDIDKIVSFDLMRAGCLIDSTFSVHHLSSEKWLAASG